MVKCAVSDQPGIPYRTTFCGLVVYRTNQRKQPGLRRGFSCGYQRNYHVLVEQSFRLAFFYVFWSLPNWNPCTSLGMPQAARHNHKACRGPVDRERQLTNAGQKLRLPARRMPHHRTILKLKIGLPSTPYKRTHTGNSISVPRAVVMSPRSIGSFHPKDFNSATTCALA